MISNRKNLPSKQYPTLPSIPSIELQYMLRHEQSSSSFHHLVNRWLEVSYACIIITMRRWMRMLGSRVLLDEPYGCEPLGLKLCINRQITKLPAAFHWSQDCQRWESNSSIRFEYAQLCPLQMELFLPHDRQPIVICEATISPAILDHHLNEEVKILLSYDGVVVGWLYCYFSDQGEEQASSPQSEKYLSMQKINLAFLEEIEEQIQIRIKQNSQLIFDRTFRLNQRSKTLFPNLKKPVRLSDVFKIEITLDSCCIRPIIFLVDHIKRGKNTTFQAWLRNRQKNKVGNMFLEYYMENLFLQNQRQLRTRKAIHPGSLEYAKTIAAKKIKEKQVESEGTDEKSRKNTLTIRKKLQEADRRVYKMKSRIDLMMLEIKNNEAAGPSLKKTKTTFNYGDLDNLNGQKMGFHYQSQSS